MKKRCIVISALILAFVGIKFATAQSAIDSLLPLRGLSIKAPSPNGVDAFVKFIEEELAPRKVNTLILRVDLTTSLKATPS